MEDNRILIAVGVLIIIAALAGAAYYAGWFQP